MGFRISVMLDGRRAGQHYPADSGRTEASVEHGQTTEPVWRTGPPPFERASYTVQERCMERRDFLKATLAAPMVGAMSHPWREAAAQTGSGWRTFETITKVEVVESAGTTRVWV